MKRCGFYLLAIFSAAFINSCYLLSENLIGGEAAVFTDDKIPGVWRSPGKPGFFIIMSHKDAGLSFHFFERAFEVDSEFFAGKTTKVGGETFLNLKRYKAIGEKAADKSAYVPAHYKLEGEKLTVTIFNTEPFDTAIAAGKLKGVASAKTGTYSSSPTRLTGTSEEVSKFILANLKAPGILDKPVVFERVKFDIPVEATPAN